MRGWLSWERDPVNPLVLTRTDPRMAREPHIETVDRAIKRLRVGRGSPGPGRRKGNAVGDRGDVIRGSATQLRRIAAASGTGWLAGLRDPQIGKRTALMHGDPARAWTVDTLAGEVHMSRSVLTERFTDLAGQAPTQCPNRCRLATAARLLRDDRKNLQCIAAQAGYELEAAFSRAFRREYEASPGLWRMGWRVSVRA